MNRRQFFTRTVGAVAAATVGPDAIRQLLPTSASFSLTEYGGVVRLSTDQFKFIHAVNWCESKIQQRVLRTLNADLIGDGRG